MKSLAPVAPRPHALATVALALALSVLLVALSGSLAFAQATPEPASAMVLVRTLNVRSGPGINHARIGQVHLDDSLNITGENDDCAWLRVTTADGLAGWVSGDTRYVELSVDCDTISAVAPAATPLPVAPSTVPATVPPAAAPTAAPTAAPVPTATPAPAANGVPAGQGCVDIGNWAGPEVIVTGAHWETREIFEVIIPDKSVKRVCLTPGRWGITFSAIANGWRDLNLDLEVKAGEVIDFPLVRS